MKQIQNKINEKGITLIALIVTIIVLIILAAVTIYTLAGENNILNDAKNAKEVSRRAEAEEIMKLKLANLYAHDYIKPKRTLDLQEIANALCDDEDIEYVIKKDKETASLEYIDVSDVTSIYTKLKAYPYEFEISDKLKIESVRNTEGENTGEEEPPKVIVTAEDIGKAVAYDKEYTRSNGTKSSEWQLLYADDENMYIITKYQVKNSAGSLTLEAGVKTNYTAGSAMLTSESMVENGQFPAAKKWLTGMLNEEKTGAKFETTNPNMQATLYMLDRNVWSEYCVGENAQYAIGSPTSELIYTSYDLAMGTKLIDKVLEIKNQGSNVYYPSVTNRGTLYLDTVWNNGEDYWVASPGHNINFTDTDVLRMIREDYESDHALPWRYEVGFRPVVCLKIGRT